MPEIIQTPFTLRKQSFPPFFVVCLDFQNLIIHIRLIVVGIAFKRNIHYKTCE